MKAATFGKKNEKKILGGKTFGNLIFLRIDDMRSEDRKSENQNLNFGGNKSLKILRKKSQNLKKKNLKISNKISNNSEKKNGKC